LKSSKVCRLATPWSLPVTSVCKKTAQWFGWWTCLSPVVADPPEVRLAQVVQAQVVQAQVVQAQVVQAQVVQVQVVQAQVVQAQVVQVQVVQEQVVQVQVVQAQRGHAQVLRLASPVRPLRPTPPWRDRTLA
jgi:hypothetical protein